MSAIDLAVVGRIVWVVIEDLCDLKKSGVFVGGAVIAGWLNKRLGWLDF